MHGNAGPSQAFEDLQHCCVAQMTAALVAWEHVALATSLDGLQCGNGCIRQRNPVLALRLHALGRDGPGLQAQVELGPLGLDDFVGSGRRQESSSRERQENLLLR